MKRNAMLIALLVFWSASASAEESAVSVALLGAGDLHRLSEGKSSGGGRYAGIQLPGTISVGDVFPIQYQKDGGTVSDSFMVTSITVTNGRCTLESKNGTVAGAMPEKIFASCRKLR
ncbi:MAG: hypothetical protein HZA63_04505 [Rhodocyclales bacterium]|nr:hypothetical protein [Rhodocyclales bacterium]